MNGRNTQYTEIILEAPNRSNGFGRSVNCACIYMPYKLERERERKLRTKRENTYCTCICVYFLRERERMVR